MEPGEQRRRGLKQMVASESKRGRFVTFEGPEGSGKSTHAAELAEKLRAAGIEVVSAREPGGTPLNEKIRLLLKDYREDPPTDRAELLLFLAARAHLVDTVLKPALQRGAWVVCDRFSDSTVAYQGWGRGLGVADVIAADSTATGGLKPDLTLLLDVSQQVSESRMRAREAATSSEADRIETAGRDFHKRVWAGFLDTAKREPGRIVRIDSDRPKEEVSADIWAEVCKKFNLGETA